MKEALTILFVLAFISIASAQKFQDTIPFRNDLGLIIIPVTFNGVEKQFAFDTGAQRTVAYEWAEQLLKPTRKQYTVVSSSGRRSKMRFYESGTINLGSRKISGRPYKSLTSLYAINIIDARITLISPIRILKSINALVFLYSW